MKYDWYTVATQMRATQNLVTRMPYHTITEIVVALENVSMWWDNQHRDDDGHHTDEWTNINGEAHEEFFRCRIHDLYAEKHLKRHQKP